MDRLLNIGFKRVGEWHLEGDRPTLSLESEEDSTNILYAFISNGRILYIGKTVQQLKKRMYGYQNPGPTQSTNIKNNRFIAELRKQGDPVEIYALPDNGLLHYDGFHVNLAAGLEDSLVAELKLVWNGVGSS